MRVLELAPADIKGVISFAASDRYLIQEVLDLGILEKKYHCGTCPLAKAVVNNLKNMGRGKTPIVRWDIRNWYQSRIIEGWESYGELTCGYLQAYLKTISQASWAGAIENNAECHNMRIKIRDEQPDSAGVILESTRHRSKTVT